MSKTATPSPAPTPTRLRLDLKDVGKAIEKAPDLAAVKRAILDLVEWNDGLVDVHEKLNERLGVSEAALDELIGDGEEGISPETAQVFASALEQSRALNTSFRMILTSEKNPLDQITTKQTLALLKNSDDMLQSALALVADLTWELEDEDDEPRVGAEADGLSADDDDDDDDEDGDDDGDDDDDEEVK